MEGLPLRGAEPQDTPAVPVDFRVLGYCAEGSRDAGTADARPSALCRVADYADSHSYSIHFLIVIMGLRKNPWFITRHNLHVLKIGYPRCRNSEQVPRRRFSEAWALMLLGIAPTISGGPFSEASDYAEYNEEQANTRRAPTTSFGIIRDSA